MDRNLHVYLIYQGRNLQSGYIFNITFFESQFIYSEKKIFADYLFCQNEITNDSHSIKRNKESN